MNKPANSISRLLHIRRVVKQHNLVALFDELKLSAKARFGIRVLFGTSAKTTDARGVRVRRALEELGPVFVKLGQALSTRPDLLPADIAAELAKLQDQVPAFSAQQSLEIIRSSYGDEFDSIFTSVDEQPLASASVAQVHAAKLRPGLAVEGQNGQKTDEVVIKVLRPGIREIIESDLSVMYSLAGLLQKHWARGHQFKPLDVIKEYDHTIHDELDLRTEAANGGRMGANFEHTDIIYVPRIYWDFTKQNVLVMERIYGTSIRDIATLKKQGIDLKQLAEDGVNVFFKQAFEDNFFHADMHPGNIFVSDQGKWIAIDFGIMGTLSQQDIQYLGQMLLGFFHQDYRSIAEAHIRAGWVPAETRTEEFEQAIRVVCEPIFAKPISEISFGNVLVQLFQTVRRFEMPVQPQLVLLYKTLLNIEGLGRQLYPQLNLWDTAKPFMEAWMKKQMSPQAVLQDLQRDWPQWRALLPELPGLLTDLVEQQKHLTFKARQAADEQNKSPLTNRGPSTFAKSLTALGIVTTLLTQQSILQNATLSLLAPWVALWGLVLILIKR